MKTVVVGLILAFLLFTPQGQGIGMFAFLMAWEALDPPVQHHHMTPLEYRQQQLQRDAATP